MAILVHDPFARLGISRNADADSIQETYRQAMKNASKEEKQEIEQQCSLLMNPQGLQLARFSTPIGGKTFAELKAELPARPRYVGPGKWKKVLRRMLQE